MKSLKEVIREDLSKVRTVKVNSIRKQIEDGTYVIDSSKIADAIITEHMIWEALDGRSSSNK